MSACDALAVAADGMRSEIARRVNLTGLSEPPVLAAVSLNFPLASGCVCRASTYHPGPQRREPPQWYVCVIAADSFLNAAVLCSFQQFPADSVTIRTPFRPNQAGEWSKPWRGLSKQGEAG